MDKMKIYFGAIVFLSVIFNPVFAEDQVSKSEITMRIEVISQTPLVQMEKFYKGNQGIARQKFSQERGEWILLESQGQIPDGMVKEYYSSGKVHYERTFKNGKRDGFVREFSENGNLMLEVPYLDGKEDGTAKEYYKNGKIHYERSFKNGKRNGLTKVFFENGVVRLEAPYIDGKEEGIHKQYYPNGVLEQTFTFKDGRVNGMVAKYNEDGTFDHESFWENGLPTSSMHTQHQYYSTGKIKSKYFYNHTGGDLKPDSFLGFHKEYYRNGQLWWEFKIKSNKGSRVSDFKEYDQDGKLISDQPGWFNGTIKDFYENGKLKSERSFVDGIGTELTCYDEQGIQEPIQKIGAITNCESLGEVLNKENQK